MKTFPIRAGVGLAFGLWSAFTLSAQVPGAGAPGGMNAALLKLFGDVKAFTAKAQVRVLDTGGQETMSLPMNFALLEGKIRVEMDMSQAKGTSLPPNALQNLQQMGLAQMVSIVRPDKHLAYVLYPQHKAMLSMPLPKEELDAAGKGPKVEKTPLGKETLDGHPCVKNKVTITDGTGKRIDATVWNASDLKDFPVQIETKEQEDSSVIRFTQIQTVGPEESQFEPPAGYTKFAGQDELLQSLMKAPAAGAPKK